MHLREEIERTSVMAAYEFREEGKDSAIIIAFLRNGPLELTQVGTVACLYFAAGPTSLTSQHYDDRKFLMKSGHVPWWASWGGWGEGGSEACRTPSSRSELTAN